MAVFRIIWYVLFLFPVSLLGMEIKQDDKREKARPPGYTFGIIPALAFDADLGIKYGGVINIFDFGETKLAPHYEQYLFIKLTNTTKGTLNLQALLESETLIKKAKVFAEAGFMVDRNLDFFGFNGTYAFYNKEFTGAQNNEYKNSLFYAHHRNFLRLRFDIQKYLSGNKLRLLTGVSFNHYFTSPAPKDNNNSNNGHVTGTVQEPTLFEKYIEWGIINPNETRGGNLGMASLGIVYDSRNDPCYCTDGKWFESVLLYSPGIISGHSFSKFILTYRQHASFLNERITLSFRLSSQQKLSGKIPFFYLPTFYDTRLSHDGVGGAFNLRGAMRNRIAASGFITGNFEIKFKTLEFSLFRQYFSASLSAFYDNALVTQPWKVNLENVPAGQRTIHFTSEKQKLHHTYGSGLYLVFNQNNVITVNYGFPVDKQLGSGGLYIGSSLLF